MIVIASAFAAINTSQRIDWSEPAAGNRLFDLDRCFGSRIAGETRAVSAIDRPLIPGWATTMSAHTNANGTPLFHADCPEAMSSFDGYSFGSTFRSPPVSDSSLYALPSGMIPAFFHFHTAVLETSSASARADWLL